MLNIQNYTKRFGDKIAVDDLSLHIAAGEICAFIGHNGAGKTTTLKACCGLLKPDGGTITVNGIDIQKDPIACKKIMAYIPDNPDLYEFLRGLRVFEFCCGYVRRIGSGPQGAHGSTCRAAGY